VYGVNFPCIPETTFYYGYFIWWGVMFLVATLIVLLFKLNKWL
jgi:Mg2+ and Co2+ transporter CorA